MRRCPCAVTAVATMVFVVAGVLSCLAETNVIAGTFHTDVDGHDVYGVTVSDTGAGITGLLVKMYFYLDYDAHPTFQDIEGFDFAYDPPDINTDMTSDWTDNFGNPYRFSVWGDNILPPNYPTIQVGSYKAINEFTAELESTLDGMLSETHFPIPDSLVPAEVQPYLDPGPQTQSNEQVVVDLADSLTSLYPFGHLAMMRIVNWCIDNLNYDEDPPPQDALSVINDPSHSANCTGYSQVAIALAKAVDIPARIVIGITLDEPYSVPGPAGPISIDPVAGSHCMLEVYYPDTGWLPYDAQLFYHFTDTRMYRYAIGVDNGDGGSASSPLRGYGLWVVDPADPPTTEHYVEYNSSVAAGGDNIQLSHVRTIPTPTGQAHADWGLALGVEETEGVTGFIMDSSVPNPFGPSTSISYTVPTKGTPVSVSVFDVAGRLVKALVDEKSTAGTHWVTWDGTDASGGRVASGVYFCRIEAQGFRGQRKIVLLK